MSKKTIEAEARILRYCGFNARADYKQGRIILRSLTAQEDLEKMQPFIQTPIHVPSEFLKEAK